MTTAIRSAAARKRSPAPPQWTEFPVAEADRHGVAAGEHRFNEESEDYEPARIV